MGNAPSRLHQQALHSGAFAIPLRQLRKEKFTQAEIAALAGLSVPTAWHIGAIDQSRLET